MQSAEPSINVKVIGINDETTGVKTFRFKPVGRTKIKFMPGQFVFLFLSLNEGGRTEVVRRAYSIASSPTHEDYFELTLKKVQNGKMTTYFHEKVSIGDVFEISMPIGKFTYDEKGSRNITLITGGCGVVPLMCIMRYCTEKKLSTKINLLYSSKTLNDIIYKGELEKITAVNQNIRVFHTTTQEENGSCGTGRIDSRFIKTNVPDISANTYYICGTPDFIRNISSILKSLGVESTKIKKDVWA